MYKIKKNLKIFQCNFFTKNRKGISGVVAAVLMIALVMVIAVIVWVVVRNIVQNQIGGVESCFGIYDKVTLNHQYTCYENIAGGGIRISVDIGDIDIDKLIISLSEEIKGTKSYTLTNTEESIDSFYYRTNPQIFSGDVKLPEKNGGRTYILYNFGPVDSIQIAPVVNGQQCEISDSLSEIDDCLSSV